MFAIDTNLLVYAHNTDSEFHKQAAAFVTKVVNERDHKGQHTICLPTQVLSEFVHVVTWQRVEKQKILDAHPQSNSRPPSAATLSLLPEPVQQTAQLFH